MRSYLLMAVLLLGVVAGAQNPRPNIIFIVTDDQHRNQFNFLTEGRDEHGMPLNLTPNIDRLAAEGVIFDRCYISTSVCTPSRYSILTGTYASRARNENFLRDAAQYNQTNVHWNVDLIPDMYNIASVMKDNGYFTGGVGKNHVIFGENVYKVPRNADPRDPDVARELQANQDAQIEAYKKNGFDFASSIYKGNLPSSYPLALEDHNMDWIVKGALEFLERSDGQDKPFFLYFATTLEHGPDAPGTKFRGDPLVTPVGFLKEPLQVMPSRESIQERIDEAGLEQDAADVLWLDDGIGALIKELEKRGKLQNTIIFFIDDHGVERGKGSLYEGGVRSVGFAWGPSFIATGIRSEQLVSNIDLVPTVLDLCNITAPEDYHMDGVSLLPILQGIDKPVHRSLFFEIGATRAVLMDEWKYLVFRTPQDKLPLLQNKGKKASHINDRPGGRGSEQPAIDNYPHYFDPDQLYHIAEDPDEQNNLFGEMENRRRVKKLKKELIKYLKILPGDFGELK